MRPFGPLQVCAVCNEARLEVRDGKYTAIGLPTEAALHVLVEKLGLPDRSTSALLTRNRQQNPEQQPHPIVDSYRSRYLSLATLEFDRDRKSMSILARVSIGIGVNASAYKPGRDAMALLHPASVAWWDGA